MSSKCGCGCVRRQTPLSNLHVVLVHLPIFLFKVFMVYNVCLLRGLLIECRDEDYQKKFQVLIQISLIMLQALSYPHNFVIPSFPSWVIRSL